MSTLNQPERCERILLVPPSNRRTTHARILLSILVGAIVGCGGPWPSETTAEVLQGTPEQDERMAVYEGSLPTAEDAVLITACGSDNPCDPIVACSVGAAGKRLCGACPDGFTGDGAELCVFSQSEVRGMISSREQHFVTANEQPFLQQTDTFRQRNVWVSIEAVEAYQAIDPQNFEQQIEAFPVGTMLMHEPVNGPPFGGVMVKREPGYDPELNDWWFGKFNRFDLSYLVSTDPRAPGYSGQSCMDCHITDGRPERTDLLWGVPRASLPANVTY